jgi:hypothetical protein
MNLRGPPSVQATKGSIAALKRCAQEFLRDQVSRDDKRAQELLCNQASQDDMWISYLELLEEDNLTLAQMIVQ